MFGQSDAARPLEAFPPDNKGWSLLQQAQGSSTTTLPAVKYDPKCFGNAGITQFVIKASISTNVDVSGVPARVFERRRNQTDPAVVGIP